VVAKIPVTSGSEAERVIQRTPLRDGMITVRKPGRVFYASRHILRPDQERLDEDFLWSNHRSYIYWVLNTSIADVQSIAQDQSPYILSGDQLLCLASDLVNGFHSDVHTLIRQSDPATAVGLDFNSGEPIEWETDSQITFLGDSIHGMTPYLGAGALLAIVDGWQLSKALASAVNDNVNLMEAVRQYEIEMRERTFPVMQKALQRMLRLTDPNAVGKGS
jgi:2-polyprenyl-6-methoxyphenol hydroxylase-like FAD-dependent oxidoreductase